MMLVKGDRCGMNRIEAVSRYKKVLLAAQLSVLSSVGVHPTRTHIPTAILTQSVLPDAKFASSNRNPGNLFREKHTYPLIF